ncbi:MAG: hypothetical protein L0312_13175 [Acidobacteria bacterium]|nr:hypothetical protein [Acidobacteriota bacterium]
MFSVNKRKLLLFVITSPLLLAAHSVCLFSQWNPCCADPRLEVLKTYLMGIEFQKRQREYQAWQERERRNVPTYNARLNGAVVAFHKHISKDNHYLTVNCSICRTYLQEIRSYSKKIEKAMK